MEYLTTLGFDRSMAENALMTRNREDAFDHLKELCLNKKGVVWEAPLSVHIGCVFISYSESLLTGV